MEDQVAVIVLASLAAGLVSLGVALILALRDSEVRKQAKDAVKALAQKTTDADDLAEQAGLSGALEAVAKLAAALKDLDRVGQFLTASIGFFAVAGVAAGLDSVGDAIGGAGS